jgi:hypothetical protein
MDDLQRIFRDLAEGKQSDLALKTIREVNFAEINGILTPTKACKVNRECAVFSLHLSGK